MNPVARFERFIERLMERTLTRTANTHLQPVEIGKRLVRAMEAQQSVGVAGVMVPNVYFVFLGPDDYDHYLPMQGSLARNMEAHLSRVARQRKFMMVSRPVVRLDRDDSLRLGDVLIEAKLQDVDVRDEELQHTSVLPQVDATMTPLRAAPNIVVDGETFAVLRSPTRIGRLPDNDIVLSDKRVSRHHAEVVQQSNRWIVRDTGSTNGTAVNGKTVKEAVLKPGDTISLGGLEVRWEQ